MPAALKIPKEIDSETHPQIEEIFFMERQGRMQMYELSIKLGKGIYIYMHAPARKMKELMGIME